ncbi:AvaI/BsoBI family type II restriction endonuclease [Microcoleus anatoxicus]|uniref:AvaI/BsoBI family type II restriction endonuclease n=1 Tax=Microcoleus anatoxicus PTRS2 TaxID=2705321 RepID=A0ABU8YH99_9CYAN|nr:MAG: Type II site-specific deoxyribonuclease [Oscillatoriales cyanobacterium]
MCAYRNHLDSSDNLVTTHEATRAGFVALALEKNRRATPYLAEARALQEAARQAEIPTDLLNVKGIEMGLLTAAGLSDKSLAHLMPKDKIEAINGLIRNFLEPAGTNFVEELVFRFLLISNPVASELFRSTLSLCVLCVLVRLNHLTI